MKNIKNYGDFLNERVITESNKSNYMGDWYVIEITDASSDQYWYNEDNEGDQYVAVTDPRNEDQWKIIPQDLIEGDFPAYTEIKSDAVLYVDKSDAGIVKEYGL